ncbi:MAG: O-antigen ligase family protein [Methylophilaceae bacterium]
MLSFYVGYITAMVVKKPLAWPDPLDGFTNVRLFQQYQLWSLGLICLPLLAFNLKQKTRMWLYFALTSWWVLLYYAASRGVVLGWLVAMVTTAIIYKNAAWPFLRIQLISAVTGLTAYYVLFKMIPVWIAASAASMQSTAITTSTVFRTMTSDRIDLWKVSLVMIDNFPLLGVGPMHYYWYNQFGTHPHNSILQLAAEFGLPATFIMLTIVALSFRYWFKRFNKNKLQGTSKLNSNFSIILFFTIIANGAYSLVEGVIVMPISQVLMFTVIGLMIGQYTEGDWYKLRNIAPKNKLRFRPVFAIVVLVAMVWSTFPELNRGLTSNQRHIRVNERAFSLPSSNIIPRIWMQKRRVENPQRN